MVAENDRLVACSWWTWMALTNRVFNHGIHGIHRKIRGCGVLITPNNGYIPGL